jgi:hypothetical protein
MSLEAASGLPRTLATVHHRTRSRSGNGNGSSKRKHISRPDSLPVVENRDLKSPVALRASTMRWPGRRAC